MPDLNEKTQISLRLPTATVASFDVIAKALDRDRSWVMLRAFEKYLAEDGADIIREAEGLASLDRGEGIDFDVFLDKAKAIVANAKAKRAGRQAR